MKLPTEDRNYLIDDFLSRIPEILGWLFISILTLFAVGLIGVSLLMFLAYLGFPQSILKIPGVL